MKSWIKGVSTRPARQHQSDKDLSDSQSILSKLEVDRSARALGDLARDKRDWAEAARLYSEHLHTHRDDAAIWVQLGHALKEAGQVREAREAYEQAVSIAPNSADAHLQLGHALKLLGLLDIAVRSYRTAQDLDPASQGAAIEIEALGEAALQSMYERTDAVSLHIDPDSGRGKFERSEQDLLRILSTHQLLAAHNLSELSSANIQVGPRNFEKQNLVRKVPIEDLGAVLEEIAKTEAYHLLDGLEERIKDPLITEDMLYLALEVSLASSNIDLAKSVSCHIQNVGKCKPLPYNYVHGLIERLSSQNRKLRSSGHQVQAEALIASFNTSRDIIIRQRNLIFRLNEKLANR